MDHIHHIELLAESVIKLEEIKQEPEDSVAEHAGNSTELIEGSLKTEVKEEDDKELEPPVAIFLQEDIKEEVEWDKEEEEEEEEEENFCGEDFSVGCEGKDRNSGSLGAAYQDAIFSHSKTGLQRCGEMCDVFSRGNDVTLRMEVVKPIGSAVIFENLEENVSHLSKPNKAGYVERSFCIESLSESGREERIVQEQGDCDKRSREFQKNFSDRSTLVIHGGNRRYECSVCQKYFIRNAHLVNHMRIHSGESPHECSVCQKKFTNRFHLVTHMRIHNGERPHECSVCQMSFIHKGNLVRHMRVHSGERPHECSVCHQSFAQKKSLLMHMRIHSGERPHECSECKKNFSRRCALVRHILIHRGERSHECSVCQKNFGRRCSLVRHVRIHRTEHSRINTV